MDCVILGVSRITRRDAVSTLVAGVMAAREYANAQSGPAEESAAADWIRKSAIGLRSLQAGSGFADLGHFRSALRGVRVVALGEATHGTREFFQAKHRMIEFLVRQMGFRTLALEVQYMKCIPVNRYLHGEGDEQDAQQLVKKNLSGVYQTEEVAAMVRWLRRYNDSVSPTDRVEFYGIDVQTPHLAAEAVVSYLARVSPSAAEAFEPVRAETAPPSFKEYWTEYSQRSESSKAALTVALGRLLDLFITNESAFSQRSSKAEYAEALMCARILVQSDAIRNVGDAESSENPRDRFMADMVQRLLERRGATSRMILWAHDFHIWNFDPGSLSPQQRVQLQKDGLDFKSLGSYLRDRLGNAYYALGLFFGEGGFQAVDDDGDLESMDPMEFRIAATGAGGGAGVFLHSRPDDFLLDLRAMPSSAVADRWFAAPQEFPFAGATFSKAWPPERYLKRVAMRSNFDGALFIHNTTRARSL